MNRKKVIPLIVVIFSTISSTYFYSRIRELNLGNNIGVILGFLLCATLMLFIFSVDLLLTKPKKEEVNQNGKS